MHGTGVHPADMSLWTGRRDGGGPEHRRWHGIVRPVCTEGPASGSALRGAAAPDAPAPDEAAPGVALVGFASDEGVRRNAGRPGAASGPDAIRSALAPLAVHAPFRAVDAGDVRVAGADLEGAQLAFGAAVARRLDRGELVVALGGGHETAWGSYLGLRGSPRFGRARIGVLNLDAHFDLREAPIATSGTPFLQMAEAEAAEGRELRYTALGISESSNTGALFRTARRLGVRHLSDEACVMEPFARIEAEIDRLLDEVDAVHLSIDLDVLPAATAPGVSAPAAYGVPLPIVLAACRRVARSGKLALVDVVELSPGFDVDGRTARAAARLVSSIAHDALAGSGASSD